VRRLAYVLIGLVVLAVVVIAGGFVLLSALGGSGEASEAISAPELEAASAAATVYRSVPEESEVRYIVDEVLRTGDNTVVGTTQDVAGDIAVDFANPANSEVGLIRINMRTLQTDSGMRDNATRGMILQSAQDAFEFAEFQPTGISGLPETVPTGEAVSFQIMGDLTVRDVTQSVVFDTTVTISDDNRLTGQAVTTVMREDFGLTIPNVPSVVSVEEEVRVELDFVALPIPDGEAAG
jgi:polyisoprenoid-binding protein YceI